VGIILFGFSSFQHFLTTDSHPSFATSIMVFNFFIRSFSKAPSNTGAASSLPIRMDADDDDALLWAIWKDHILPYVAPGQYRFVGGINRRFRSVYLEMYSAKTMYRNVHTVEQA